MQHGAFTIHVRLVEEPGCLHAVDVSAEDTVGDVVSKAAGEVKVDPEDITLYHESVPLDDLKMKLTETTLGEASEVEGRPSKRYVARRELERRGLGWGKGCLPQYITNCKTDDADTTLTVVQLMIDAGADVDEKIKVHQEAALHIACQKDVTGLVEVLLKAGADLDATDASNETPLHHACNSENLETARFLIQAGASLKAVHGMYAPLHISSSMGCLDFVKYLIESGADVNAADASSDTALHFACAEGRLEVVRCLVKAGADPNAVNCFGNTPRQAAAEYDDVTTYLGTV